MTRRQRIACDLYAALVALTGFLIILKGTQ